MKKNEIALRPMKESLTNLQKLAFTGILTKIFELCKLRKQGKLKRSITGTYIQPISHEGLKTSESPCVMFDPEMKVIFIDNVISTEQGVAVKNLLRKILGRNVNYTRDHNFHVFQPVEIK